MNNNDSSPHSLEYYYHGDRADVALLLPQKYTKVLEIGCGDGGFAANLGQPHELWGIEPVEKVAKIATNRMDKVLIGSYESVHDQLPDQYFDLVVCNDVIEHMIDPDIFFESIKSKLQPNSYIIGSIPNVRFVWNLYDLLIKKDWEYTDSGILDRTHLKFFTKKSLQRLFLRHNFIIEEFHGINSAIYPAKSKRGLIINFILRAIIFLSLGSCEDIKFLQFTFKVKYSN